MTREKIEGSPLRRKMVIGAAQPETAPQEEKTETKHNNIKTSKHKGAKTASSTGKIRTTIYIPEELAIRLKIYAAQHRDDVSGIIVQQIEKLLDGED